MSFPHKCVQILEKLVIKAQIGRVGIVSLAVLLKVIPSKSFHHIRQRSKGLFPFFKCPEMPLSDTTLEKLSNNCSVMLVLMVHSGILTSIHFLARACP